MGDLDDLLQTNREEGRLDSSGTFSLELSRAHRLLRQFQLPDSSSYILKLIQWAVASGARSIDVQIQQGHVSVTHNGRATSEDELGRAWGDPVAGTSLSNLVLGPMAGLSRGATSMALRTHGPSSTGVTLSFNPTQLLPESALVTEKCKHASVLIRLNGTIVNQPIASTAAPAPAQPHHCQDFRPSGRGGEAQYILLLVSTKRGAGSLIGPSCTMGRQRIEWHIVEVPGLPPLSSISQDVAIKSGGLIRRLPGFLYKKAALIPE